MSGARAVRVANRPGLVWSSPGGAAGLLPPSRCRALWGECGRSRGSRCRRPRRRSKPSAPAEPSDHVARWSGTTSEHRCRVERRGAVEVSASASSDRRERLVVDAGQANRRWRAPFQAGSSAVDAGSLLSNPRTILAGFSTSAAHWRAYMAAVWILRPRTDEARGTIRSRALANENNGKTWSPPIRKNSSSWPRETHLPESSR